MVGKEGLYSSALNRFSPDTPRLDLNERIPQSQRDFFFAMHSNGYIMNSDEKWLFNADATKPFTEEFQGQNVTFYGPGGGRAYCINTDLGAANFIAAFEQKSVTDVIGKYRTEDEDQAARLAFIFGGIVRHLSPHVPASISDEQREKIKQSVKFAAQMTKLGERQSADAIASAMAMYTISGGSLDQDNQFTGHVYHMGEAVRNDPVEPVKTVDLGISQTARLKTFIDKINGQEVGPLPDISEEMGIFEGYPTVGAEFHFTVGAQKTYPNFWKRLALLNMSQYQRGSYIQLSREDRDVIEVRMNPSVYPVTVTTWHHMRQLLPELQKTFFTTTINRVGKNFYWNRQNDKDLLHSLRGIGMLSYAGLFDNMPKQTKSEEIDFGKVYLGQTIQMDNGRYNFDGMWGGGDGDYGQFGVYAGFGDNLPDLSYFLSMVLARPDIIGSEEKEFLSSIKTVPDALGVRQSDRLQLFQSIQDRIEGSEDLSRIYNAGNRILEKLNT